VEHPCHKCGAELEDGTAFCSQCGAPQIRVSLQAEPVVTPPLPPGTPGEVQPPAEPVPLAAPPQPARLEWSQAVPAAAIAGMLLAIAWVIPFSSYFLWMLAAGALAVALYRRRQPGAVVTTRMGARVGAVAGLIAFALFALLLALQLLVFRGGGQLRDALQQMIRQSAASNTDPRAQEMLARMLSPEGMAVLITVGMVIFFLMFVGLSSLGGALGAKLFGERERR
jgi:hypothetical protein